ncbi:Protein of unknown function (DUF1304) domain containing protein [Rhypophila sp. PSN 637]
MGYLSTTTTATIGLIHTYITLLEMYYWDKPRGIKTFGLKPDFAKQTKPLAANQGLYNGFLAAGLFWGAFHPVEEFAAQIRMFFLGCVVVAGVFGGATANTRILFVQALPAAVSMGLIWLWG